MRLGVAGGFAWQDGHFIPKKPAYAGMAGETACPTWHD